LDNVDIYGKTTSFYIERKDWPNFGQKDNSLIEELEEFDSGSGITINIIKEIDQK